MLLLTGTALGVTAVLVVQERYLPPRLSAAASAELRAELSGLQAERDRLQRDLGEASTRLARTEEARRGLEQELAGSRATIAGLREDVASALAALPPDPRGGAVEVRAGRFSVDGGQLVYDVVLSRERGNPGRPFQGVMQFVVAGDGARGNGSVALKPLPVSIGHYQSLRGSLPLPPDFRPSQATIRVLDRPDGRQQGMRVMLVK
ncbi:hypothetical protein [Piscinibacter sakaiensis]|uniref:hypothetical protein n=1 Tax=Piscinibacter sakaiensis TaxID=1547922 RepID=UPI001E302272|nr:hypothetical protein [Piscinibacter sakaiensis]